MGKCFGFRDGSHALGRRSCKSGACVAGTSGATKCGSTIVQSGVELSQKPARYAAKRATTVSAPLPSNTEQQRLGRSNGSCKFIFAMGGFETTEFRTATRATVVTTTPTRGF